MVAGILPYPRYVVLTDRLISELSPEEVEAVFGHEVGHVRHHHMLYYLGFLTASMAVLFLAWEKGSAELQGLTRGAGPVLAYVGDVLSWGSDQFRGAVPVVACMLTYIFVVFGFLSRRCERQADVFGCRAVSCRRADCPGHEEGAEFPPGGRGLCPTGIRTFIRALEKVALVNGISRDKPGFFQSWQHSTIARRVEFLQRVLQDPRVERRFQRRVAVVKWAMFLVLGAALGLLVWSRAPVAAAQPAANQVPAGQATSL